MVRTFKVLSVLVAYPTEELKAAAPELRAALTEEGLLGAAERAAVLELVEEIATRDLYDLQERYVLLFDRSRSLSLHLFEHVHGEGRDRGQAMVDLLKLYEQSGLRLDGRELPDFLPLFLEYLSTLPLEAAREHLAQPLHILAALHQRLRRRQSIYAGLFAALESLARGRPAAEEVEALLGEPDDDPADLAALDRAWEDAPVTFGPSPTGNGDCPRASAILGRMGGPTKP